MEVDATPSAARAPNDVSIPRRARDESVPRRSVSPLCDALFVETVSTMPGAGAHEMRGGHEHTETLLGHVTQETVVPTADVAERCARGDGTTQAYDIDTDDWWSKVDRTPIGAHGGGGRRFREVPTRACDTPRMR